ncbi:glycosyltransferase [Agreia pratensis]|uniref:Rhamnosyltransferase n=1 Tax=Agreia pratensis TaxID=150121 RepID=A0A1X7IMF9_9MICO|nr:glycosyltransferase [Agreia pratensis]SMG16178.1 rhamnosyltransferase [Agreia pratensis]
MSTQRPSPGDRVVGVLVAYNTPYDVLRRTAARLAPQLFGVFIMDNSDAFDDSSHADFSDLGERVEYIPSGGNIGIAEAQNRGVRRAIELGADFVLFLDDDSSFPDGGVETMLRDLAAERHTSPDTVGIGPKVVDERSGQVLARVWNGSRIRPGVIAETTEVAFLVSSGALIDVDAFARFGMFRSDYFIDHVDQEWGLRVGLSGGRLVITPNVTMFHKLGDEPTLSRSGNVRYVHNSPTRDYYLTRNAIFFMRDLDLPLRRYPSMIRLLVDSSLRKVLGRSRSRDQRVAVLKGLTHGILNRRGKL